MFSKRSIIKWLFASFVMGLILFIFISAYFLTQRNKTVALPKSTGSFDVGRIGYDWTDASRNEVFSAENGEKRKLSVWIWYPSDLKHYAKRAEYFPNKWETEYEKNSSTPFLEQNFNAIQTNSFEGVPLSSRQTSYPIIIFEPGMGDIVFNYQTLAENLASHGYIVVGVNPTYSSRFVVFSDGKVAYRTSEGNMPEDSPTDAQLSQKGSELIKTWTEDISFVINKLGLMNAGNESMWKEHLDMEHIGAFGHSFGGAASAETCLLDNRVKAGIDIDGYLYGNKKGLNKPFMFIMSKHQHTDIDVKELKKIKEVYSSLSRDGYLLEIPKASHYSFQDNSLFFNPILNLLGTFGTINGVHGLQITNSYLTAFFDKYLKNRDSTLLNQKTSYYKDVIIQMK